MSVASARHGMKLVMLQCTARHASAWIMHQQQLHHSPCLQELHLLIRPFLLLPSDCRQGGPLGRSAGP
jgi:hypothetical protein